MLKAPAQLSEMGTRPQQSNTQGVGRCCVSIPDKSARKELIETTFCCSVCAVRSTRA